MGPSGPGSRPMPGTPDTDVTRLLQRMAEGDAEAEQELLSALYDELYTRAQRYMRGQSPDHTLQATALVNEAYLRLVGPRNEAYNGRGHFLSVAAKAMRSVLVDHARGKRRDKRNAVGHQIPLDQLVVTYQDRAIDLIELDEALERLAEFDPKMARAVELRFFGALSVEETARLLDMSKRTFERNWRATRAWLHAEVT